MKHRVIQVVLLFLLAGIIHADNTPAFRQQIIEVPVSRLFGLWPYWKDINGDGLTDLLALSQEEGILHIYNQNKSGFPADPTQTIKFPEGVAWFTLYDASEHPGDEMLISTNEGLVFYPQNNGVFEIKPEKLIEAKQVIPQNHPPIVKEPDKWPEDSKNTIPIVFSDHTVIYKCDENYQFEPERKIEHEFKKSIEKDVWDTWNLGSKKSSQLWIRTTAQEKPKIKKEKESKKANESVEKILEKIQKYDWYRRGIEKKDINADGREDLVLWHMVGDVDCKITIMVFIRQEDDKLPEKPNQILRCRGFAIDRENRSFSILNDIDNDGVLEIVLAELKTIPHSASSLVEMVVSKGAEFTISIRQFKKPKGYPNKADFKMDITTLLPMSDWVGDLITFGGDFNADGQKDLIVRRRSSQCNIYLSSPTSGFYDREPEFQLEVPAEGRMSLEDLNNDGISDIYLIDYEKGQIAMFLSNCLNKKGALQ